MKCSFFQAAVVSILQYGCTLTKHVEKKLDGNYTRMLRAILNKSRRQHTTKPQLYGHLSPITKTIKVIWTRHAGHCWRSRDELIRDVLQWTPSHGRAKAGRPARTYLQQLCEDTGCNPEDLPEAMNDREVWRERVRDIRAGGMTSWWWCHRKILAKKIYSQKPRWLYECHFSFWLLNFYERGDSISESLPSRKELLFVFYYFCILFLIYLFTYLFYFMCDNKIYRRTFHRKKRKKKKEKQNLFLSVKKERKQWDYIMWR